MSPRMASALVPALALALVLPLAGCSDGGGRPRLVVGDGPPTDEWGLIGADGGGERAPSQPPAKAPEEPERRRDRDDGRDGDDEDQDDRKGDDGEDDGDDGRDGDADTRPRGPLLVLAAGDAPGTFVVTGHAAGADWGDVAVAADAGSWTLVLQAGSPGQYDFGEGLLAAPDPGAVRDRDVLRFCDRSSVDGVTGSYVQVEDVPTGEVLLRERVQGSPC